MATITDEALGLFNKLLSELILYRKRLKDERVVETSFVTLMCITARGRTLRGIIYFGELIQKDIRPPFHVQNKIN